MKLCTRCGIRPERLNRSWCGPCLRAAQRNSQLKAAYGITTADYDRMLAEQAGVCAICLEACRSGKRLAVDHNHETGAVRGLLCSTCNRAVGLLRDDSVRFSRGAEYLSRYNETYD